MQDYGGAVPAGGTSKLPSTIALGPFLALRQGMGR